MSVKEMLEAGVHFGHQTHRWDPRMKPFIFGSRNGIHIIDLQKTVDLCREACAFIAKTVSEGGNVLFVGTKRQAQPIIEESAKQAQMFYVSHRWLGGTLTNFKTIQTSINRLKDLEKKKEDNALEGLTKKEKLMVEREIINLTKSFGGIKDMNRLPAIIFIVDPHKEDIALLEANRLKIPVVAIADTNCNPEGIDYLVPGNDDAIKSIRLFTAKVVQACLDGMAQRENVLRDRIAAESGAGTREAAGGRGKAFVTKAEAYEAETDGEYTAGRAASEIAKEGAV
ncbi:MAG TPA: 30S ribosomal protein S2 [bacterium]|nr:30S ribosomal protein S2 [bacterium]